MIVDSIFAERVLCLFVQRADGQLSVFGEVKLLLSNLLLKVILSEARLCGYENRLSKIKGRYEKAGREGETDEMKEAVFSVKFYSHLAPPPLPTNYLCTRLCIAIETSPLITTETHFLLLTKAPHCLWRPPASASPKAHLLPTGPTYYQQQSTKTRPLYPSSPYKSIFVASYFPLFASSVLFPLIFFPFIRAPSVSSLSLFSPHSL